MPKIEPLDLFVVVCTDLHVAVGPFVDLPSAVMAATKFTEDAVKAIDGSDKPCVFLPVPFRTQGQVQAYPTSTKKAGDVGYVPGPYTYL